MGLAVVENLIRFSRPGNDHVCGSHIFSFYNWVYDGQSGWGVVAGDGTRRATYYALRLAIRALAGEKPTFQATTETPDLSTIATKEADGRINLLVVNWSDKISFNLTADLPGLMSAGNATIRQFSATVRDEVVGQAPIEGGKVCFAAPPWSAVLVTCRKVGDSAR
jgi:hypothetical protein